MTPEISCTPRSPEGQFVGGLLHGLAGALYEELRYTETGDFLTGTLMDYLCPTVSEMPDNIVTDHIVLPTPQALTGGKGSRGEHRPDRADCHCQCSSRCRPSSGS